MNDNKLFLNKEEELCELLGEYISEKNHDKSLEWLEFKKVFKNQGKQGVAGLMKIKDTPHYSIFKTSRYLNHLVKHEYLIMKGLNNIRDFCPHFCKVFGKVQNSVDSDYKRSNKPFEIKSKYPIQVETLLLEYIPHKSLYAFIKERRIPEKILYSSIKQTMMAIAIAQKECKLSHYDLHSSNIMMTPCDKNSLFLYVLDEGNQFCIPTFGYYPKIIDFGFSYSKELEDNPIYSSLAHTDVGFMTNLFDEVTDSKLFLVTVSDEIKRRRHSKYTKTFRNVVRNIFKPLNIDWESGWDNIKDISAADCISQELEDISTKSALFNKYNYLCIDLIQTLIVLPLKPRFYRNIKESYKMLTNEFCKVEKDIGSSFYNLYIFKGIIDAARDLKQDYESSKNRAEIIVLFKTRILDYISSITKFCYPSKVNFEKLLCSIYVFSQCCEGILHDAILEKMTKKNAEYDLLDIKTPEQMYGALEVNIPSDYNVDKDTKVYIFDCVNKERNILSNLDNEQIEIVNSTDNLFRGSVLYDIFRGSSEKEEESEEEEESENEEEEEERESEMKKEKKKMKKKKMKKMKKMKKAMKKAMKKVKMRKKRARE